MKRTIFTLATLVALGPVAAMAQQRPPSEALPADSMSVALAAHFDWSGNMDLSIGAETGRSGNIEEINGEAGVAVSLISDIAVAAAQGTSTLATASSSSKGGAQATAAATVYRGGSVSAHTFGDSFNTNITAK